jgi:hypothetical protein
MSLRPILIFLGIVGLLGAAYLVLPASSASPPGMYERGFDGPLFALATAFVSIMLLAMSRERRTAAD